MEELEMAKRLGRVKAPLDFEQRVLTRLQVLKGEKKPALGLKLSLAGAFAVLFVGFLVFNTTVLHRESPGLFTAKKSTAPAGFERGEKGRPWPAEAGSTQEVIPVIETLDYLQEIRGSSSGGGTVYLLEQISDTSYRDIIY